MLMWLISIGLITISLIAALASLAVWLNKRWSRQTSCPACGAFIAPTACCPECGAAIPTPRPTPNEVQETPPEPAEEQAPTPTTSPAQSSDGQTADLADEALSDSLRGGFRALKAIMICLAVAFVLSGVYWVDEGTVAIHLRFGDVIGEPGQEVVPPGGPYFALPSPADEIIVVPTTMQVVPVERAFWFGESEFEQTTSVGQRRIRWALDPAWDGSLLTGDKNLVHGGWTVTFQVRHDRQEGSGLDAPKLFAENVGSMERAWPMVTAVAEEAIVRVIARTRVDDFIKGRVDNQQVGILAQQALDRLRTGITITTISLRDYTVPIAIRSDFQAVTQAESEKALEIEKAERARSVQLNAVAGTGYPEVLAALDAYERTRESGDTRKVEEADDRVSELLVSDIAGGKVAEIVGHAKVYRTKAVELVRGVAERFARLLELYKANPRILRQRQLQDTLEKILKGNVEKFYLPPGRSKTLYLDLDCGTRK